MTVDVGSYYSMSHGIAPNGGGTKVNQWTLLIDFRIPALGVWHAFFQTDAAPGDSDAEYFINTSGAIGVGDLDYSDEAGNSGFLTETDTWYRLVFVLDVGASLAYYYGYIDGVQIATKAAPSLLIIDERFSPDPVLLLFSDNNAEDGIIDVSTVAIWDQALDAETIASLGGAGASTTPGGGEGEGEGEGETEACQGSVMMSSAFPIEGDPFAMTIPCDSPTYAWYKWDDGLEEWVLSGEERTLTFAALTLDDSGVYRAVWDDGVTPGKAEYIYEFAFLVLPADTLLPGASLLGLALLGCAGAIGGAGALRRRRR